MKTVAFVPAKGNSERITNKNLRIFNGEPLFIFTLRKLLKCKSIDEVYIDSDCDNILELGVQIGAIPLKRSKALSSNKTDGNSLFYNEINQVEADIYIQHLCTSPFVYDSTIENAIKLLKSTHEYDSVVLGRSEKMYPWSNGEPAYCTNPIPNSVDLPETNSEAMSFYAVKSNIAHETKGRIGNSPLMLFADPVEAIDINTEKDLELATLVANGYLAEEEKKLRLIGKYLTSPILSDIFDELNLRQVLPPKYNANFSGAKLFGRARTLHIREANSDDDTDSIYDALNHYKSVVSNDVLVVKNDLPELAYFGELNTSLAIRSGAIGAIISGVTRDSKETSHLQFPVFSKGNYCVDIKGKGAVESINKKIVMDGITVMPSDLIFADSDGIIAIPRNYETQVIKSAIERLTSEKGILTDVCKDVNVDSLVERHGFF